MSFFTSHESAVGEYGIAKKCGFLSVRYRIQYTCVQAMHFISIVEDLLVISRRRNEVTFVPFFVKHKRGYRYAMPIKSEDVKRHLSVGAGATFLGIEHRPLVGGGPEYDTLHDLSHARANVQGATAARERCVIESQFHVRKVRDTNGIESQIGDAVPPAISPDILGIEI